MSRLASIPGIATLLRIMILLLQPDDARTLNSIWAWGMKGEFNDYCDIILKFLSHLQGAKEVTACEKCTQSLERRNRKQL